MGLKVRFNDKGQALVDELVKIGRQSRPALLVGPQGMGKSVLLRYAAKQLGRKYYGVNCTPNMDPNHLFGMWRPKPIDHAGITVAWENGPLTVAAKEGSCFLCEEITRSPQELMSRLFNLLNNQFRSLEIPECGTSIEVHPDFWFVASANPVEAGYYTVDLDEALKGRFAYYVEMKDVVVDEALMLEDLGVRADVSATILKIAEKLRGSREVFLSTRAVCFIGQLIMDGFKFPEALARAFVSRLDADVKLRVVELLKAFDVEIYRGE